MVSLQIDTITLESGNDARPFRLVSFADLLQLITRGDPSLIPAAAGQVANPLLADMTTCVVGARVYGAGLDEVEDVALRFIELRQGIRCDTSTTRTATLTVGSLVLDAEVQIGPIKPTEHPEHPGIWNVSLQVTVLSGGFDEVGS